MNVVVTSAKTATNPTITPISWRVLDWISGRAAGADILRGVGERGGLYLRFLSFWGFDGVLIRIESVRCCKSALAYVLKLLGRATTGDFSIMSDSTFQSGLMTRHNKKKRPESALLTRFSINFPRDVSADNGSGYY